MRKHQPKRPAQRKAYYKVPRKTRQVEQYYPRVAKDHASYELSLIPIRDLKEDDIERLHAAAVRYLNKYVFFTEIIEDPIAAVEEYLHYGVSYQQDLQYMRFLWKQAVRRALRMPCFCYASEGAVCVDRSKLVK